ncbi:uncharacterized protein LY89DRAFT_674557 [Mollisia scopiformis]|uniref:2EXR domain-containing protein n=1 Tax=Mollisia scopiformis TaxID=149040 RepID=A0A194WTD3_MOLSC|nr:uncharacterized protein LY89DRAFT_674557 [Mollisia scopiformis]KUJ11221.1 hypothetical protein LY89DRAFT_674557 [Mollisia scopiformis]
MVWRLKTQFHHDEEKLKENNINTLLNNCWIGSIDEARKRAVPAYTFTKMSELPLEIQLKIWGRTLSACRGEPRMYRIDTMTDDKERIQIYNLSQDSGPGTSRAVERPHTRLEEIKHMLVILQVCQTSRMAALEVCSVLQSCKRDFKAYSTHYLRYYATRYDKFALKGSWYDHKFLVDILANTIDEPPSIHFVAEENSFLSIQRLIVDLNIFAKFPLDLWAQFYNLRSLTISMLPDDFPSNIDMVKSLKFCKRVAWVREKVLFSLQTAKKEQRPDWRIPKIKITGDFHVRPIDVDVGRKVGKASQKDAGEFEDDAIWYQQTVALMTHTIPHDEIRRYKLRYSRKVILPESTGRPEQPHERALGEEPRQQEKGYFVFSVDVLI